MEHCDEPIFVGSSRVVLVIATQSSVSTFLRMKTNIVHPSIEYMVRVEEVAMSAKWRIGPASFLCLGQWC